MMKQQKREAWQAAADEQHQQAEAWMCGNQAGAEAGTGASVTVEQQQQQADAMWRDQGLKPTIKQEWPSSGSLSLPCTIDRAMSLVYWKI